MSRRVSQVFFVLLVVFSVFLSNSFVVLADDTSGGDGRAVGDSFSVGITGYSHDLITTKLDVKSGGDISGDGFNYIVSFEGYYTTSLRIPASNFKHGTSYGLHLINDKYTGAPVYLEYVGGAGQKHLLSSFEVVYGSPFIFGGFEGSGQAFLSTDPKSFSLPNMFNYSSELIELSDMQFWLNVRTDITAYMRTNIWGSVSDLILTIAVPVSFTRSFEFGGGDRDFSIQKFQISSGWTSVTTPNSYVSFTESNLASWQTVYNFDFFSEFKRYELLFESKMDSTLLALTNQSISDTTNITNNQDKIAAAQESLAQAQHEDLVNGYDDTSANSIKESQQAQLDAYQGQQDEAINNAYNQVGSFTDSNFNTDDLAGYTTAFAFVGTCFNDLWSAFGEFKTILVLMLTLGVAGFILQIKKGG